MRAFTVNPRGWWLSRLVGRNPLLRRIDRIEALVAMVAVIISLAAVPVAAIVGVAVHAARDSVYAEQARSRHTVAATVLDSWTPARPFHTGGSVRAGWNVAGADIVDTFAWDRAAKAGDRIDIWVDSAGRRVDAPPPGWRASLDGAGAGAAVWFGVLAVTTAVVAAVHARLDRVREAQWEREIRHLADDGGGRTNRQH